MRYNPQRKGELKEYLEAQGFYLRNHGLGFAVFSQDPCLDSNSYENSGNHSPLGWVRSTGLVRVDNKEASRLKEGAKSARERLTQCISSFLGL